MQLSKKIEFIFESLILNFRFFVLLPVVFGLIGTVQFFILGTLDIWAGARLKFDLADPEGEVTYQIVSYIIGGIDYYLIGIVLLIFSFGIYELFISEIDVKFQSNLQVLQSESLEELKSKLVRVIVVALIVSLFKKMLSMDVAYASDLIYLALTIFFISVSSYLLHMQHQSSHDPEESTES